MGEIDARVRAYKIAVALERLIYRTVNAMPDHEATREEFVEAVWPLMPEAKAERGER